MRVSEEDELPPGDEELLSSPNYLNPKFMALFCKHNKSALIGK